MKKLSYPILAGDLKKAIESYKDDSFIELGLVVNGEVFVCVDKNTDVAIKDVDEGEDVAGTIEINFDESSIQKFVKIKGKRYNLKKNLQDFVKCTMKKLLETNSIPDDEIQKLLDMNYCKKIFNLDYPLLSKNKDAYKTDNNHSRYYTDAIWKDYYLCNNWYSNRNESKFSEWLKSLA